MNEVVLNPAFHPGVCVLLIIAIVVLFAWKEFPFSKKKIVMILPITLVNIALAGLLLRPSFVKKESSSPTIVLTKGYDRKKVDSLLSHYRSADVILMKDADAYRSAIRMNSNHKLISKAISVDFVLGEGLPDHVLDEFPNRSLQFLPGNGNPGITKLHIPDVILPNRDYELTGRYSDSPGVDLVFSGPEGKIDSIHLDEGDHEFRLGFRTIAPGSITYTLKETRSEQTLRHTIPVTVQNTRRLRVLILEQHPTFESLYLKNVLARDHQVTIRHQLSKGIFRYEHINAPERRFDRLNSQNLDAIDVLMIDDQTLTKLSETERNQVDLAIRGGLGCLIMYRARDSFQKAGSFLSLKFTSSGVDTIMLPLDKKNTLVIPVASLRPIPDRRIIPLLKHNTGPAGYVEDHFGKRGYTLLTETYPLMLRGDSIAYGRIWTSLVEGIARVHNANTQVTFDSSKPHRVDEPLPLMIRSNETPRISYNSAMLPVHEDELIDNVWTTTLWPDTTGWQEVVLINDSTRYPFYVHPENELSGLQANSKHLATMRRHGSASDKSAITRRKEFDPLWYYVMFLCGAAWLWVWPKIKPMD